MGTRCAVSSRSITGLLSVMKVARSVTLDWVGIKRYRQSNALADTSHHAAPDADAAPRGGVAQAPANGRDPTPGFGLDPAREPGDDRAVPMAGTGDPVVSR